MSKVIFFLFLVSLPMSTFAQRVVCEVFTPETAAKMQSHNIQFSEGIAEYMTARELSAVLNRAVQCEVPQPQLVKSLDTAIAWRVTKFSQTSEQLSRMFEEYCASYGQESVTSTIAIKWLAHNNFVARFNAWDAADVQHNWNALPHTGKPTSTPTSPTPDTSTPKVVRETVQGRIYTVKQESATSCAAPSPCFYTVTIELGGQNERNVAATTKQVEGLKKGECVEASLLRYNDGHNVVVMSSTKQLFPRLLSIHQIVCGPDPDAP